MAHSVVNSAAGPGDSPAVLSLPLRRQVLLPDARGYFDWRSQTRRARWAGPETALILCDVWDRHWCRGAAERLDQLIPQMDRTTEALRQMGVSIIHSPSDTMPFYADHPARWRIQQLPGVDSPEVQPHEDPPLPIDDSDGGSDTGEKPWYPAWTRQHEGIRIDEEADVISDDFGEIWSFLQHHGIRQVLFAGVHTNMCVLHRPFGIKKLVRCGVGVALVRDLTDTMYNPACRPYVSHDEGTRLVIEYIEKFWCATIGSHHLTGEPRAR